MLLDKELNFSFNQEIKSDVASTNTIKAKGEIGAGTPKPIQVQVVEDFTGLEALEVEVQTSATQDFTQAEVLQTSGAIPLAKLKKGFVFGINYMPEGNKGFVRLFYKVTGTGTAGRITSAFVAALEQPTQNRYDFI